VAMEWRLAAVAPHPRARAVPAAAARARAWRAAAIALIVVIWAIPIKSYKLPVALPFNLEPYRLLIVLLLCAWLLALPVGMARFSAAGHGRPTLVLALAAFVALFGNRDAIAALGLQTQALKSLSFFLAYLIAFLLLASTLEGLPALEAVARTVAGGASLVAVTAIIESRTHYNVFQHLQDVVPFLTHIGKERTNFAGGALRVRASAQHPIALGAVLVMTVPLSLHFAQAALTKARSRLWLTGAAASLIGALATESRTAVLMLTTMLVAALWLYGRRLLRYWPLLIVFFALAHFAAPGVISHVYKRFDPKGGLVKQQQTRAGQRGSGRLADLGPGLDRFQQSPLYGYGLGTVATRGDVSGSARDEPAENVSIIFDDQYMNTLVGLGALGFFGVVWFVWGAAFKIGRAAKREPDRPEAPLLRACAISCFGFALGLLTFDAFSFVQSTLIFYVIAAIGLAARRLSSE
jgi:O-antigen ligase/polysaccharide polymerase Wzy-like membrane protein